jgi:hypothetical protein
MTVIRVNFLDDFDYGDDAVLLTMDGEGVDTLRATVVEAIRSGSSQLDHDGVTHIFQIESGAADIDLDPTRIVWHLDLSKAHELELDLEVLRTTGRQVTTTSTSRPLRPPWLCRGMNTSMWCTPGSIRRRRLAEPGPRISRKAVVVQRIT